MREVTVRRADGPRTGLRRPWSLKVYVVGLVAVVVVAAGANLVYQRQAAANDATSSAAADARYGAEVAAHDISAAIELVRTAVAATAGNPGLASVFAAPAGCTLSFGGAGAFGGGHLDVVGLDGTIVCSSSAATPTLDYAGSTWLADALEVPTLIGPVVDIRTGEQVVLVTTPVAGLGAVAAFLELDALGSGLASAFGGPRQLEFVVTNPAGSVLLTRSIDPERWIGASVAGTPFATTVGQSERRDLDGAARLYGQAVVENQGWIVFAGASKSTALAAANRISDRQLAITVAGLVVLLAAASVLYRRVARPIGKLSKGVRSATACSASGPIMVTGPAEIATLVDDFNGLIAAATREREATSRLAALVESSADAIIGKTLDGTMTSWNAGAEHMFGYAAGEIVGRHVSEIVSPDRIDELTSIVERVKQGERVDEFETTLVRRDGSLLDVSMRVSPIRDGTGAMIGASTVSRDMTDRNRAEADRRSLEHRLRQSERLESLGQLAGGIAHDFNNLLAVIMNYAAFVARQTADQPAVQADIERIQTASERAARLTKQLLTFARRETIQLEVLDLNAIVTDMENLLSRSLGGHIELVMDPADQPQTIRGDRGQIEQVLLNLAVNARDAMPQGGILTMSTGPVELGDVYVRRHPDAQRGRHVELTVSDTGSGMTADVARHILEPFFTTKPKGQGTGLGLATVFGIVTAAGGSMTVDTEPGVGSTFRLYFPTTGEPAATKSGDAAIDERGDGEVILVVEDEPDVLELTCRILRQDGYAVLAAATYQEALSLAATRDFQLLLTDSVMPHMSGPTLAQRVEALRPGRAVLFMSGYSDGVVTFDTASHHPAAAFIEKPFNRRTLIEKVQAALASAPTGASGRP